MEAKVSVFFCIILAIAALGAGIVAQGMAMPATLINWTASKNPINYGDTQVLTATLIGGTGPFTYNFLVYNASGTLEFNALFTSVSAAADSFAFQQPAGWGTGAFAANIIILDSAYPNSTVTNSLTYMVQSTTTTSTTSTSTSSTSASSTTSLVTLPSTTSTSTSTIIQLSVISAAQNAKALLGHQNGRSQGSVLVQGNVVGLVASGSVLKEVDVELRVKNLTINVSITNQSQMPVSFARLDTPVYQFIQINGSVANDTGVDIDQYVTSATYNFSVSNSWIQNQGVGSANIRLFKYDNASSTWNPLPTSFTGSNALDSFYSATSNSFSGYVVSYIAGNTVCTTQICSNTIAGGFTTYFWAAGMRFMGSLSSSATGNWVTTTTNTVRNPNRPMSFNEISIGYNTVSNIGTFITTNAPTSTNTVNSVLAGIGVNVIIGNGKTFSVNAVGTSRALSFNAVTSNSFVVLMFASGGAGMSRFTTNAPGNSIVANSVANSNQGQAAIVVIPSLNAGNGYNAIANSATSASLGVVAYVFPTYAVQLVDIPSAGNIITSNMIASNLQYANGITINVIGTQSINAIAPASGLYPLFNKWTASNTANLIIASSTSANTFLTVEGNGILTATFNAYATFSAPKPSNIILDAGQSVIYNTILANGIGPFTINIINTGTSAVVNTIISATAGTMVFGSNIPAQGTQNFNVIGWDTGATPNYAFNSVPNTIIVNTAPQLSTLLPSNVRLDFGQSVIYNVILSGGTGPFTVNLINTGTSAVVNTIIWSILAPISNVVTFGANIPAAGTDMFNVIATDTGTTTPFVFNSASNAITVNALPTVATLTPSNILLDAGQSVTYNVVLSGGNGPFTVNLINTGTSAVVNTIIWSILAPISNVVTFGANIPAAGTDMFNVIATDTGTTTPFAFNSVSNAITVNAMLAPTISSNPILPNTLYTGQTITFTASTNGGVPSFTYNYLISNTITNNVIANQLYTNVFSTSNTFAWTIPSNVAGNTLQANVFITDSASTFIIANSPYINTLTVLPSVCFTSISVNTIDFGTINPTTSVATNNAVTDNNIGGTSNAYLYVFGGNWLITTTQANGFGVGSTSWATSSGVPYASANYLSASPTDTFLLVPSSGGNTVYFGLYVPPGTAATSYNQIITIENSC